MPHVYFKHSVGQRVIVNPNQNYPGAGTPSINDDPRASRIPGFQAGRFPREEKGREGRVVFASICRDSRVFYGVYFKGKVYTFSERGLSLVPIREQVNIAGKTFYKDDFEQAIEGLEEVE